MIAKYKRQADAFVLMAEEYQGFDPDKSGSDNECRKINEKLN